MALTAAGAVEVAFLAKMQADTAPGGLMTLVTCAKAAVPPNQLPPYVTLSDITASSANTFSGPGRDITVTLDVWSESTSDAEADTILARLDSLFDRQPLTLSGGWHAWNCINEHTDHTRTVGDVTRHLVVRYRLRVS